VTINEIFIWSSGIIAFMLNYPLISGILKGQIKQNVATWILWISLDVIALVSIILQKGNYILLIFYCTCGTIVILCLLYKRLFKWTKFETFISVLVCICLIVWYVSGPKGATIASTIAVCISGLPQIRDSWLVPNSRTGWIYVGFIIANGLFFLGGKAWTIEDRFYPGMMAIMCFVVAIACFRDKFADLSPVEMESSK
jgi:hypothetical protein